MRNAHVGPMIACRGAHEQPLDAALSTPQSLLNGDYASSWHLFSGMLLD